MANISRRNIEMLYLRTISDQRTVHSVNLGIFFLIEHNLKTNCTEEEVALIPLKDGSASSQELGW